jgi:hypothetical protein
MLIKLLGWLMALGLTISVIWFALAIAIEAYVEQFA